MVLTPLIDIDNLDPTNGIIYFFEPLWSLMTNGERIVYKDSERERISHRGRDMRYIIKERDQLKLVPCKQTYEMHIQMHQTSL